MSDHTKPADDSAEYSATTRLADDSDEHEAVSPTEVPAESSTSLDAPPRPKLPATSHQKPSAAKLKAMLEKSKQLSEQRTVPRDTDEEALPSLGELESDVEQTDEMDAVADEPESEMMTAAHIEIAELAEGGDMPVQQDSEGSYDPTRPMDLDAISAAVLVPSTTLEQESDPSEAHTAAYVIQQPLAPSGEYGVLPGIGEHSRSGQHVLPRPVNRDPKRVIFAMIAVGCFAVVIAAVLVVQNWLVPQRAFIWIGAAALASTLLMGLIAPWEHDGGPKRSFAVRVVPGLMFTCAALIAASAWSFGAVRALAVGAAPDDVLTMERILDDESADVAAAGCERYMAHHDDPTWWGRMLAIVSARPAVAATCLRELSPELQAAVAGSLIDRWSRELLADEGPEPARACAMASGLTQMPLKPAVMSAPLLDCTLSAADETTQACCGEALAATVSEPKQWATRVFAAASRIEGEQTPSGVFSMAFQPDQLSKPQREFAEAVKFDGVMGRGAALALVCETMSRDSDKVIRHLRAVLDGECDLNVGELSTKVEVWEPICESTRMEIEADRTRPPVDTLCEMTRETVVPDAIDTARRLVSLARVQQGGAIAAGVHAGYDRLISSYGVSGEFGTSPMALTGKERHDAMMAARAGGGTVVFVKDRERRKFERDLDPQSRKELRAWEKRRAERMRQR